MDLETRLKKLLKESPDSYNRQVVARVRAFVRFEDENPEKGKPYNLFNNIYDWVLYHRLHPEWQGMSPTEIKNTSVRGLNNFYGKLLEWCHITVPGNDRKSKAKRDVFKRKVLDYRKPDYNHLRKLKDWIDAKQENPEWADATSRQMQRNEVKGGNAFYMHCREFVRRRTDSPLEQREMMAKVFKPKYNFRNYTSIDQWAEEYKHKFKEYSMNQLDIGGIPGGRGYMSCLRKWLNKRYPESPEKREHEMRKIFKSYSPNDKKIT